MLDGGLEHLTMNIDPLSPGGSNGVEKSFEKKRHAILSLMLRLLIRFFTFNP